MVVVATEGGPEADHAVHLPLAISRLAVQWSAGVPPGKARVLSGGAFELGWGDGRGRGYPSEPRVLHVGSAFILSHGGLPCSRRPALAATAQDSTVIPTGTSIYSFCVPGMVLSTL